MNAYIEQSISYTQCKREVSRNQVNVKICSTDLWIGLVFVEIEDVNLNLDEDLNNSEDDADDDSDEFMLVMDSERLAMQRNILINVATRNEEWV